MVIKLDGVTKAFGSMTVIKDLSFTIRAGEIVGLLGPNGSGKTTTVRLINGVIAPNTGSIEVFGRSSLAESDSIRARTGVLTETAGLYGEMTARENLAFFAKLYGLRDPQHRVEELLETFGLCEHKYRKVGAFSTGMRKRLGIAKALVHRPDVLFLDEPTTGLDPEASRDLLSYIEDLNKNEGVTILLATHLLKQVQDLCHRFLFLHEGRLIEAGTLRELEDKYLRSFQVKVETDLVPKGSSYLGFSLYDKMPGFLIFNLQSKEQIPILLSKLLQAGPVYSAEILGRDLETLYFNIRGEVQ